MNLLKEGSKNHEKAKGKVDVQCLHVGYLWQSPKKHVLMILLISIKPFSKSYLLTAPMSVTMVRTVVTPSPTLAGAEPRSR